MKASAFDQIRIYVGKCFRLFRTKRQYKNFISAAIIMALISMVTGDKMFSKFMDTKNGCFAIVSAGVWIGLFNSIQSVCSERAIIKREHRTGLRISSYILAHVIYEAFLCMVETLIILAALLLRNMGHLPASGVVLPLAADFYITLFLVVFASDMTAVLISCIVHTTEMAMTVMPFVLIIQLVMSGAVFALNGLTEKISYLTITRWGLDGMLTISNTTGLVYMDYLRSSSRSCEPEVSTLLHHWLMLLAFSVVYILLSILFLSLVDRDER